MAQDLSGDGGPDLVAVTTVFLVLGWVSVSLRTVVRIFLTATFNVDDWLMVAALLNFTLMAGFVYGGVHFGLGRHNSTLTEENEILAVKYQALATILYISSMGFVKLSIGFFLLRIAVLRRYIYTLRIAMAIMAFWTTGIFLFEIFQCQPVAAQWDTTIPDAKCASAEDFVKAAYAFSAMAVLSDWLFALLPIPMIWNIQMTIQTKIVVIGLLSMGICASIATLIRIRYLVDLEDLQDLLFSGTHALMWSIVEPGVSITAASLATLRPLLRKLKVIGFGSSGNAHRNSAVGNVYERPHQLPAMPQLSGGISTKTEVKVVDAGRRQFGSEDEILGVFGSVGQSRTECLAGEIK